VSLYQLNSGRIIEPDSKPQKGDNYFGQGIVESVMIFPVQEKYVSKNPYHELDSLLRLRLEKTSVCIVVGHAFNDEAILNAFVDSMMRNMALRLLLLSHSPEKIVKEKFPLPLRERVIQAKCEVTKAGDIADL
jgi:hypothetical protein